MRALQKIGTATDTPKHHLNYVFEEVDLTNGDFGIQCFVYKKLVGDVAISVGSPVGSKATSGGGEATADQSAAGASGILGCGGGISTISVGAGATKYGWVQFSGVNRYALKAGATGSVAAGDLIVWDGDDSVDAMAAGEEHLVFARALVAKDANNQVPAGGLLLL